MTAAPTGRRPRSGASGGERGSGMIGTLSGVVAFLLLLMLAAQVLVNLFTASMVTAAAFDAARLVAGADGGSEAAAEAHARGLLGEAGRTARFEWRYLDVDGLPGHDRVALRVRVERPSPLLPAADLPFDVVDRTVEVRLEGLR